MSSGYMTIGICQNLHTCTLRKIHFTVCNLYLNFFKGKEERRGEGWNIIQKAQLVWSLQGALTSLLERVSDRNVSIYSANVY